MDCRRQKGALWCWVEIIGITIIYSDISIYIYIYIYIHTYILKIYAYILNFLVLKGSKSNDTPVAMSSPCPHFLVFLNTIHL